MSQWLMPPTDQSIDYLYQMGDFETNKTFEEAIQSENSMKWHQAMKNKISALDENETFEYRKLPTGANLIGGKWVYTVKRDSDVEERYEARYLAKGYSQIPNIDYKDTFCPAARSMSIRMLLQIAM